MQVHEAKRTPNHLNAKRPSPRHLILKLSKANDKEFERQPGKIDGHLPRNPPLGYQQISQQKPYQPGEGAMTFSKD